MFYLYFVIFIVLIDINFYLVYCLFIYVLIRYLEVRFRVLKLNEVIKIFMMFYIDWIKFIYGGLFCFWCFLGYLNFLFFYLCLCTDF